MFFLLARFPPVRKLNMDHLRELGLSTKGSGTHQALQLFSSDTFWCAQNLDSAADARKMHMRPEWPEPWTRKTLQWMGVMFRLKHVTCKPVDAKWGVEKNGSKNIDGSRKEKVPFWGGGKNQEGGSLL